MVEMRRLRPIVIDCVKYLKLIPAFIINATYDKDDVILSNLTSTVFGPLLDASL